jgi:hypothetical protein
VHDLLEGSILRVDVHIDVVVQVDFKAFDFNGVGVSMISPRGV